MNTTIANTENTSKAVLVDEGEYQGRPFRRYSDGSYKAATSSGWMKFISFSELERYAGVRSQERLVSKAASNWFGGLSRKFG